jgi:beta-lactamase class A
MTRKIQVAILFALLAAAGLPAQPPPGDARAADLRAKLARDIQQAAAGYDGVMGIAVKDLASGETFFANADVVFPQGSSIKIPILLELLRQAQEGKLRLEERLELRRADFAAGSGVLQRFSDGGSALALRDLAVLMIVLSDNTATNLLIDRLSMPAVNDNLARLGLKSTRLERRMMDTAAQRSGIENPSTPREMVTLLELLDAGKVLDARHSQLALEILKYPKESHLRAGVPAGVPVAHKPGGIGGVACDSAIVYLPGRPYLISVMTTYNAAPQTASQAITEVSRRVFGYFERLARSNAYGARVE